MLYEISEALVDKIDHTEEKSGHAFLGNTIFRNEEARLADINKIPKATQ